MAITGSGTDTVNGGGDNDTLIGLTTGASTMADSGAGDQFNVTSALDVITDTGTDGVIDSTVSWNLGGTRSTGVDDLILTGSAKSLTATGNTSSDVLSDETSGSDTIVANNKLLGNSLDGNDTFTITHAGDTVSEAHAAGVGDIAVVNSAISFTLGANLENLDLSIGAGNLHGVGNTLANDIVGNTGNDTLSDGDAANDSVVGFAGDTLVGNSANGGDTFIVNFSHDVVTEAHASVGGAVSLVESTASFTLGANMEALTLSGAATITGTGNSSADVLKSSTTGTDALIGNGGADTFYLNHANDTATERNGSGGAVVYSDITTTLTANMSALTLTGSSAVTGTGNNTADVLTSNTGIDSLVGHSATGDDTFYVNNASDKVTEAGTNTGDLVVSDVSFNLATDGATASTTTNINHLTLTGTGTLIGTGNANADVLTSSTTGVNKLIGDGGADTFNINHISDTAVESNVAGGAIVNSTISFTLGANMSELNVTGTGLTASASATGNTGNDTITSTGGVDTLVGNIGADSLQGDGGADVFKVNGVGTTAAELNVAGGASVISDVSFTLGANMSSLTLSGASTLTGTGNNSADVLTSSTTGTDALIGKGGADTFYLNHAGDTATESNAAGGAIVHSSASATLTANMAELILTGSATAVGQGNTAADMLVSNTGKDTLIGDAASGVDTFVVNNIGDSITESGATAADDVVVSDVTFSLLSNASTQAMHSLTLTGAAAATATGNHLADVLTSSATGVDKLIGNDTTVGTSDTFNVNHASDTVTELSSSGTASLVNSTISFTLGNNLDNLTLTGTTNLTGVGNTLANVITGNTGTDLLKDGNTSSSVGDTLIGNSAHGTDSFIVNSSLDVVSEANAGTTALVTSDVSWDLGGTYSTGVNHLTLTGAGALTGTGNTNADVLISSTTGTDVLFGNSLTGGDTFVLNHAGDTATELGSTVGELIISNVSQSLTPGANDGAITLSGTAALTATGNQGADTLTSSTTGKDALIGDTASGGDTFFVYNAADTVTENGAGTTGNLVSSTVSFNLQTNVAGTGHVDNLTFTGTAAVTGAGNLTAGILTTNTGKDIMVGHDSNSATNDTFVVHNATDTISEAGASTHDLVESTVSWTLGTANSFSALTLEGTGTRLIANGNGGADIITDSTTGTGANILIGHDTTASTDDTFIVNAAGDTVSEVGAAATADSVFASVNFTLGTSAHFANLTLTGGSNLTGIGNNGSNVITGNTGNDVLNDGTDTVVGAGDTLIGNSTAGNDTFIVNNVHDHVTETTPSSAVILSSVSLDLGSGNISGVNNLTLTATGAVATGNTSTDVLKDGGINDTLIGNSTDGTDTFILTHAGDSVTEANAPTTAQVQSSVTFDLANVAGHGVNELALINGATGQTATGNSADDILTDNDTVVGGGHNVLNDNAGGHDTLVDTAGNDTFVVNSALDSVTEAFAGSTVAAVDSSVNYTLGANINSLTLTAGAGTIATGNSSGGDTITGNTNADVLNDNGATTADHLIGHSSTGDTFLISNVSDTVSEAGTGTGSIIDIDKSDATGIAYSLAGTGANELEFTVGTGNDTLTAAATGNDTLIGSAGNSNGGNIFHDGGSAGAGNADTMEGNSSAGNDTFYVNNAGDLVTETGTATAAVINTTVGFNLETGAPGGGTTNVNELSLTGIATGVTLMGNALNDTITDGTSGTTNGLNVLADGVAGTSNGGHDTLIDGSTYGGDTFIVNSVFDSITESGLNKGTVESSVNYTLGTNFNVLTLEGSANAGTGNAAGGDSITGSTGNAVLSDNNGTAADTLIGESSGTGDTFVVYNATDVVSEGGSTTGSVVELQSGSTNGSFSLTGTGIHKLTMYGTGDDAGTGTTGGDTITGNTGNDTLSDGGVGAGGDSLQGHSSTGGDVFVVNNANDTINEAANIGPGGDGIVTSLAMDAYDSLTGDYAGFNNLTLNGSTDSTAVGNNLANLITGNNGDDTIISGTGTDTLVGRSQGTGDTFEVSNANDHVTETGTNTNALITSSVNFNLGTGGDGTHTTNVNELTLTAGNITATGNMGSDTITGDSAGDVLITTAGAGLNSVIAGTGLETFIINNATDTITEANAATGSVVEAYANFTLSANLTNLTLENGSATFGAGNGTGGDTITGNTNNDTLSDGGNAAAGDSLIGNSTGGNDTFLISNASDTITETNGIGASATIESTISYTLGSTYSNLELVNGATGKTATGNSVNDSITDNDTAGGGNVLTDGNAGGLDTMIDNAGNDTFVVNSALDSVTEAFTGSTSAAVDSSVTFALGANLNNLTLEGNANISGTGNATGGNVITGNDGNDVLNDGQVGGVTAADTLIGNSVAGHDTFVVYNTADSIVENGAATGNEIETSGTYSVASIAGIEKVNLEGTTGGNTITGNTDNDTLTDATSGAHSNILVSGSGTDSLVDSNTTSTGDTFYANAAGDQISEDHGAGTVIWGSGLSVTYTLGTDITNVTLQGAGTDSITANSAGGDVITAGSGSGVEVISDGLAGAGGNDTFNAGAGTLDTFIVNNAGDVVNGNNTGNAGDVIDYYVTGGAETLAANINNLVIESNGSGGNDNDTIYANTGNDSISANTHSNTFYDGGAHDGTTGVVTSTGGADTFSGGGGFDIFNINNGNDVIEEANPGQYLINSWTSYALTTNLGNLTLMGQQNLTGTATTVGGAVIVGNSGSDILSDGGDATVGVGDVLIGNDTMGGPGDTFIVNNAADTVSETGSYASTVEASVSFTLGLGTTHLLLTGTGNLHGTANTTNNNQVLVGNAYADVLSDGGNDTGVANNSVIAPDHYSTMIGHSGTTGDTFMVYDASDSITELGGATGSVIDAYVNYTLVSNVNTGNIEGNENKVTLTGNSAVDTLTDNSTNTAGGNVLVSGTGADALVDASTTGGDTFIINNTSDTVAETNGTGVIESYVSFSIASDANIHTLTLEGSGNATAAGHAAGGDTLTANTGTDILSDNGASALDHFVGGTGHDTFIVSLAGDTIDTSAGGTYTIETGLSGAGFDTLTAAYTGLILTAGGQSGKASGSASDIITGEAGHDTLSDTTGDTHADTLIGTGGNDVFNVQNVGDSVTETGASATVNADVSFTMGANINVLNLSVAGVEGTANNGADTITATGGTDTLVGGTGADSLSGNGAGDVYYVNGAGTTVAEAGSGATVHADVNFTLGANMTTLDFSGDINLTGTGNGGADTITGNLGDDLLSDGGGASKMVGMSSDGGDTFDVSNASDVISEANSGNTALVNISFSGGSLTLGTNIENVAIAAGHGTDTIIGNGTSENLTMFDGGTGGDVLNANGSGADTLTDNSSAGGDTFDVNNALDVVSAANGTTGVVIYGATGADSFTLSTHITTLDAHTTTGNDTFTGGGAGGDSIIGGLGSDIISDAGGTGGDTITGHSTGVDTFLVTNISDVIDEAGTGSGIIKATNIDWSLAAHTTNVTTLDISTTGAAHTATGLTTAAVTLDDLTGGNALTTGTNSSYNDTLIGGADTMTLTGGTGHDTVEFSAAAAYNGVATINHFNIANDTLNIDNIITGGNGGLNVSYKFVDDGSETKVYVDYNHTNPSYSFVQIATLDITGENTTLIHVT